MSLVSLRNSNNLVDMHDDTFTAAYQISDLYETWQDGAIDDNEMFFLANLQNHSTVHVRNHRKNQLSRACLFGEEWISTELYEEY